jgi:hypothetical protein
VLSDRAFGELREHADLVSSRLGLESSRVQTLANQLRSVWAAGELDKLLELGVLDGARERAYEGMFEVARGSKRYKSG